MREVIMTTAKGQFELASWNEDTYQELGNGGKLTRASVTQQFSGDVTGVGAVEWPMCYQPDGTARFVGWQQVDGAVGGTEGSFVLETAGDFDGGKAVGQWTVVPGSGTGGLTGLTGSGRFEAPHGPKADFTLAYDLG
jgi:subtilisin family serine protease